MKQLLFATSNPTKAKRFSKGLLEKGIETITLKDLNLELGVEENGKDAIENAIIKAKAYHKATGLTTLAMDDNLYLDNVPDHLQPGIYVRRVNGKTLTDQEMIKHYTTLANKYGEQGKLTARWIYGIALITKDNIKTYTWSKKDFYITDTPSNIIEPGYPLNSISINKQLGKYFTDLTSEDKILIQETEEDVINFILKNI